MRKLKLFLSLLMVMLFSVGNVWAVDYDLVYTLDGSVTSSASGSSAYATAIDIDVNDITWNVMGNTTLNPWGIGGKNLSSTGRSLFSKGSIDANIVKIDIEHGAASSVTVNAMTVEVATDADFTDIVSTCTPTFAANSTITVNHPDGDEDWSNCYYRITYSLTIGSSNKKVEFKSAKFYKEKSASDPTLEADPLEVDFGTVEVGASVSSETVAVTFANLTDDVTYSGLTSPFSASGSVSSTGDEITISADASAAGTYEQTLTIQSAADSKSVEVTVKMKVAAPTGTFELFDGDIEEGDYVLVGYHPSSSKYYAMNNTVTSNQYLGITEVSIASDQIVNPDESLIWTIEQSTNGYYIKNGDAYLDDNATSSKNYAQTVAEPATTSEWNFAYDETWTITNYGTETTKKTLSFNVGSTRVACYTGIQSGNTCVYLYKKVDGAVKPSAELAFTDAQKLAKLGAAFTAQDLTNPHELAVSYESSDEGVIKVNATTGAITEIVAAGKAVITASFAGDETYKAGSASYTIFVAEQAGTESDPLSEANAKTLIDNGCTLTVHVNGLVLSQDDGNYTVTLTNGFQFYKAKDLNNVAFESAYLGAGDEVTAVGALKKFSSTYELDEGCYLTFYEAATTPLTPIANDKDHPYTVAQALAFAAAPTTYDLSDHVYIQGVVYSVKNFNSTNGTYDIYIKDAGTSEEDGKFEFYKCAGLYQVGEDAVPFEEGDVQEGDEVIGYGVMTYYSGGSIWEFGQPNQLVSLNRPEVAVTGVELNKESTSLEVGETETLVATVAPANATNKAVTWASDDETVATVDENGVVTAVAGGTTTITVTTVDGSFTDDCEVTVTAADPTVHHVTFIAGTDQSDETSITKDGITISASTFNNASYYQCYSGAAMTVSSTVGNITKIELTCTTEGTAKYGPGNWDFTGYSYSGANGSWTGSAETVEFGNASQQVRMTLITVTYKEDNREAAGLAWNPADDIEITVGDAFSAPALQNPNSIDASEISIESSNTSLATVTAGVVSLVADATGTATITATFNGNDDYKPATVSYNITVNEAGLDNVTFDATLDIAGTGELSIAKSGFTLEFTGGAMDNGENYRLYKSQTMTLSASDYLIKKIEFTCTSGNPITGFADATGLDKDNNEWTGESNTVELTASNAQVRMTKIKVFYVEDTRAAAGLAWNPADDIELTVGDAFSAPALLNPNSIDAAEISIESSNTDVATVTAGVVALVADATGEATITATFAGNASYKPATVSYKITVNPAYSIYVQPSLNVNFGSVNQNAEVADKSITVTLTGVDAATLTLAGAGASAFTISPAAALTASGDVTISASSANIGTFAATLTISDDAGNAESKVVNISITVNEVVTPETPVSTTSKWVPATDGDLVDGAEVLIVGVHPTTSKVYAAGEQGGNNRAAVEASVDGEGVLTPGDNTMSFILEAQEGGKFALRTSTGKYLCAASSGSNYLRTQDVLDDNGKWTLTTTSAVANGSYTRNTMFFNSSSSLFACYASSTTTQQPIAFYVPKPVTPPTPDYTRTVEINRYGTICLPNGGTISGAKLFDLEYYDGVSTLYLLEVTGNAMEAGKPYVFLPSATTIEVFYTDDAGAPAGSFRGLVGSYSQVAIAIGVGDEENYILYNNAYYLVNSTAYVGANRAYIHMAGVPTEPSTPQVGQAPRRRVAMAVNGKQTTTGIDALNATEAPVKMIINGQLFILRGEKKYDATGRLVK